MFHPLPIRAQETKAQYLVKIFKKWKFEINAILHLGYVKVTNSIETHELLIHIWSSKALCLVPLTLRENLAKPHAAHFWTSVIAAHKRDQV